MATRPDQRVETQRMENLVQEYFARWCNLILFARLGDDELGETRKLSGDSSSRSLVGYYTLITITYTSLIYVKMHV